MPSGKNRQGGRRWQRVRDVAFQRDKKADAVCWLCGMPIDYDAEPGTPDAWSPDHIKPVSRWPELEYSLTNIAPSHYECNISRQAGEGIDRIGVSSRRW